VSYASERSVFHLATCREYRLPTRCNGVFGGGVLVVLVEWMGGSWLSASRSVVPWVGGGGIEMEGEETREVEGRNEDLPQLPYCPVVFHLKWRSFCESAWSRTGGAEYLGGRDIPCCDRVLYVSSVGMRSANHG
jgi:hypothetical protein